MLLSDFWLLWRWLFGAVLLMLALFRPRLAAAEWVGTVLGAAAACAVVVAVAMLGTGQ